MPIDPSIALRAGDRGGFSLNDIMQRSQERDYRDQQMQMQQRQATRQDQQYNREEQARGSLADLLATRKPGGGYDMNGAAAQTYRQADPEHYAAMLDKLDATQREHVKAGLADMSAAVQWAQTPQQWSYVQQHYAQFDPALAQIPFEQREQALVHLGQMGDYLKANKHEFHSVTEGGSAYDFNPATGQSSLVIGQNPGNQQQGAPMQGAPQGTPTGSPLARPQQPRIVSQRPAGMSNDQLMAQAHEAVRGGANVEEVFRQLQAWGVNP